MRIPGQEASLPENCDYHPDTGARWYCAACTRHYCHQCMPQVPPRQSIGACPRCGERMHYFGDAGQVRPFWREWTRFPRYPLHQDPLLVMLLCTLVPLLMQGPFVTVVLIAGLFLVLFKYLFEVIERTGKGQLQPPSLDQAFTAEGYRIIFQQAGVLIVMTAAVYSARELAGNTAAIALGGFFIFALPASMVLLVRDHDLGPALNPLALLSLILRLGPAYPVLFAMLAVIVGISGWLGVQAQQWLPHGLGLPAAGLLLSYALLMFFHLLGYSLYQYQALLGVAAEAEQARTPAGKGMDQRRRLDADLDRAVKEGEYDQAQKLLEDIIQRHPGDDRYLQALYRLIEARDDSESRRRHHRKLLRWLVREHDGAAISQLLRRILREDGEFQITDAELSFQCAQLLFHCGDYRLLFRLLRDFGQRFPDTQLIPDACLLTARTLANARQDFRRARAYLEHIRQNYPEHALNRLIPHYLAQVEAGRPIEPPD